jgi:hypothetical protein
MLFFLLENYIGGRTKMIEDGIMDMVKIFKRNATDVEEVAFLAKSKSN